MAGYVTYVMLSPFPLAETMDIFTKALQKTGKVITADKNKGYILSSWKHPLSWLKSGGKKRKVEFFIERGQDTCKIRSTVNIADMLDIEVGENSYRAKTIDTFYDLFLFNLFNEKPGVDFGISLANKNAFITDVLFMGGELEQVQTSRTIGGRSLSGFLLGGALFGDIGAVVGGMTGTRRTVGHTYEKFSDSRLVRVIYNNGRIGQGNISVGSRAYQEMMVNMK